MDKIGIIQSGLGEIQADWLVSSLHEKQNYILELEEMQADAIEFQSARGTDLLRDVCLLRDFIEQQILHAQHERNVGDFLRGQ